MSRVAPAKISLDEIGGFEESKSRTDVPKAPLLGSARMMMAVICFTACATLYSMNVCLSLSLVCMLNHTAINSELHPTAVPEAHYGRCPARNGSEPESKSDGEFVWDKEIQGLLLGAFFWGYCMPQIFYGLLAQKYNPKLVLLSGMGAATAATLVTPLAARAGIGWLLVTRFLVGFTAAAEFPSLTVFWSKWAPRQERTVLLGMAFAGSEVGNIVSFVVSGEVCTWAGWQAVFYLFGGTGVVWCLNCLLLASESPAVHPRISAKERQYIESSVQRDQEPINLKDVPWRAILTCRPFWAIVVVHFSANYGMFLTMSLLPTYMSEVLRFDIKSNGFYSALPFVAVLTVIPIATICSDLLRQKHMSTGNVRKLMTLIGHFGGAAFFVATGYLECHQTTLAVAFLTLSSAMNASKNAGFMVNFGDIAPKWAGLLAGISNTIACAAGFLAPLITSFMTEDQTIDEWRRVFWLTAGILVGGAVFYTLFGSGEVQSWAEEKKENKTKSTMRF